MAQPLRTELGIHAQSLRIIGDARLADFRALWKARRFHTAVYIGGYALEEYLKCAICKALDSPQLPRVFEYHELDSLLFYSGLKARMQRDSHVRASFGEICGIWREGMRYEDPNNPKFSDATCRNMETWLNDKRKGVIPWLRQRF